MKLIFTAAILLSVSFIAYPSEKGGNTFRSYELEIALEEYDITDSCPVTYDLKASMKVICDELAEEIMMSLSDKIGKRFYRDCCKNKD